MKIALVTDGMWPFVIGGMQRHSYYLCKFLARNKIHVDLYHTIQNEKNSDISTLFTHDELKYIRSFLVESVPSDKFPGHYIRTSIKYSNNVLTSLRRNGWADLIYAKGLTSWGILKSKSSGEHMPPVCINVHGYEYYQKSPSFLTFLQQLMLRPAFRFVNEQADYIYSYGHGITRIINRHIRNRKGKIIEIPTGIDEGFLVPEVANLGSVRQFIFVGRHERRKGVVELNRAIRKLKVENEFKFHFIGDIPEEDRISLPSVIYHGELQDKEKVKHLLRLSDVLVCPSYAEGMPNVILEGMASGCAIIASNVGAVSLQVSSDNGWLVRPGSTSDIEKAMSEAISMSNEQLMSKKLISLNRVREEFLWDNVIQKVIESFNNILQKDRDTPV